MIFYGSWALKPSYLGPWTLRARDAGKQNGNNYIKKGAMLGFYTDTGKENGNYNSVFLVVKPSKKIVLI